VFAPMPRHRWITPEGYPFIALGSFLTLITFLAEWKAAAILFGVITLFICFFFRNPKREAATEENVIVAPADGKIIAIADAGGETKISTFMSVFNCHVNRVPVDGEVCAVNYRPGSFFVASLNKASEHNERNTIIMKDDKGRSLTIVQIAGVVARRIVCYLTEGVRAGKGARLGLIRFGSRVDLFLPRGAFNLEVKKGDRVRAGRSVIGRWK